MQELKSKMLTARPEQPLPLSLSVSKVKTFKDCKAKYRFSYIEKLPRKEWDFHIFGKFLHEILENFHKTIINGNTNRHNVIMTDVYKHALSNWKDKLTSDQKTESQDILKKYLVLLNKEGSPNVTNVEKEFYIDVDGTVLLNGFIDRVQIDNDETLHVADYKTTKHKKYLKNDFFQLMTYAFVMCLEDENIKKVRTSYILLRHGFESIVKEFERDEVMKMEDVFLDYYKNIIDEKLYRPSPTPMCKYCDALDHCEEGRKQFGFVKYGATSW